MNNILLFGAGKSSSYLIKYLLDNSEMQSWLIYVADKNTTHIQTRFPEHKRLKLVNIDINNDADRQATIAKANIVISLLPPALHLIVAKDCLVLLKNLITASYISPEMMALDEEAKQKGLLFMCEMGLDPGIDHMSATKIIEQIGRIRGEIYEFKSHCGGLIAPESDTNPWHYKVSWNPRNVVLAGGAGADYLENGVENHLDYKNIFKNCGTTLVAGVGELAYYPNRNSLSYINDYKLGDIKTLVRTTLRHPAYTKAWQYIVQMGLTSESITLDVTNKTFKQCLAEVLNSEDLSETLRNIFVNDGKSKEMFEYLGWTSEETVPLNGVVSVADITQYCIENKWKMQESDKDMIVMQHEFKYHHAKTETKLISSLVVKGENNVYTAMAKTVGLPMGILAKLILNGKIEGVTGVKVPVMRSVFSPVLKELEQYGIIFKEEIL